LGNKSRILDAIEQAIDSVSPAGARVCDLFSGSGVVAWRLGRNRPVLAVDIQEYSRVLTSALLCPKLAPVGLAQLLDRARDRQRHLRTDDVEQLIAYERIAVQAALSGFADQLCDIVEYGSIVSLDQYSGSIPKALETLLDRAAKSLPEGLGTVLTRYYGGTYFSYEQALALDAIAGAVRHLQPDLRDTPLAALLGTASDIVSTVGNQFAQPVRPRWKDGRPKVAAAGQIARRRVVSAIEAFTQWLERYQRLAVSPHSHLVLRSDFRYALDQLPGDIAAIYADPPYTRDHYSRFYHVLETIALGDEPQPSTVKVDGAVRLSRALYRHDRHQSPFSIKTQVLPAFKELFRQAQRLSVPLVLSYSPYTTGTAARPRPRLVTVVELVQLASKYFPRVTVQSAGRVSHSKLNQALLNGEALSDAEVLLIARP